VNESSPGWVSPLGASTVLFVLYGVVWFLIGVLTPFLHDTATGRTMLFLSPRTDTALFGADPTALLADPSLSRLRSLLMISLGSVLAAAGILVIAIALFALRAGQGWALAALTLAGLVVLPFWLPVFRPYAAAGIAVGLADVPPFMWVPTALLVPAVVLGWIGLR
jgi:hypothetical protein